MFDRTPALPGAAAKGSAISQSLSLLGTAFGVAAAILLAPVVFGFSKPWLLDYLSNGWGSDLAVAFTYLLGGLQAWLIFLTVKLCVSAIATWLLVTLASRSLHPNQY